MFLRNGCRLARYRRLSFPQPCAGPPACRRHILPDCVFSEASIMRTATALCRSAFVDDNHRHLARQFGVVDERVDNRICERQKEKENQYALVLENQTNLVCPNFYNVVIEFSYTVHIVNSLRHINRVKRMSLDAACHKQRQQHECEQSGVVEARIVERKSVEHLVYVN